MFTRPETVFTNQKWSLPPPKDHFNNGLGSQGQATQYMDVSHLVNQQSQSHDPVKFEHVSKYSSEKNELHVRLDEDNP